MPQIIINDDSKRLIAFGFTEFEALDGHTIYDTAQEKLPDEPRFCKYNTATGMITVDQDFKDQFLANKDIQKQLRSSDGDMIRIVEDLLELLDSKGILSEAELPQSVKDKLSNRRSLRSQII